MKPQHQTMCCSQNIHCIFSLTPTQREEKTSTQTSVCKKKTGLISHMKMLRHTDYSTTLLSKSCQLKRSSILKLFKCNVVLTIVQTISCMLPQSHLAIFQCISCKAAQDHSSIWSCIYQPLSFFSSFNKKASNNFLFLIIIGCAPI